MPKKEVVSDDVNEYDELSLEELDQEIIDLSNERAALRDRQVAATAAYDAKANEAKAARLTATMTDPEKAALMQHLVVDAAASDETPGTPGAGEGDAG